MFVPAVPSDSRSPQGLIESRRAAVVVRRAALAVALCCAAAGCAGSLAAQSAPKGGSQSHQAAPRAWEIAAPSRALDDSSAREVAREIEELAPLEEALRDVHGLTQPQSDSLALLEQRYAKVFASLAGSARTLIDDASSDGLAPNVAELRSLCQSVWSVRSAELVSARAVLATRAQRARFDANVTKIQCEEAELVEDVLRRSSAGRDGSART